jgi:polyphenol oxidase
VHHNHIIQSKILSQYPELVVGVSTRYGGISPEPLGLNLSFSVGDKPENVLENRRIFFRSLGISELDVVYQRQTHSTNIKQVTIPGVHDSCDALITKTPGIFLAVSIADCLPVFIYDSANKVIAGVHAGWRGSRDQIVTKALGILLNDYRSNPVNLVAYVGPGADACCYEVGEDVAGQFPEKYIRHTQNGRTHLNLKMFNQDILLSAGIPQSQIELSEYCTICNPQLFHSYRRDKAHSGRMMAVVGMKKA